jgi:hypothetical protein
VKNEVPQRDKEVRNFLQVIRVQRRKDNWIGHYWRRNCLLRHAIEGKIEESRDVKGRRGRRRKQLLVDIKEREDTVN